MYRYPFTPYPNGWFRLAYSHQVPRGTIRRLSALGQELIVFRGDDGRVAVLDAYCPHLGADLSAGGKVVGNVVACPFHNWQFAADGQCVKIPYCEKIPKKAATRAWPVCERDGVVYFYFDAEGRPPAFEVPAGPFRDDAEWSAPMFFEWRIRMHIQEVVENAVDTAHFPEVHAYAKPPVIERLQTDGASFTVDLATQRFGMNFVGPSPISIRYTGMGVTHAHLTARLVGRFGIEAGVILNTTPVDEEHCTITIMARYRKSWNPLWNALLRPIMQREIRADFENDIPIWEAKRYHERPLLSKADGPIHVIRKWCQQFYTAAGRSSSWRATVHPADALLGPAVVAT
jgi:phenylpropionate dioxygenase-like ring-hydroxylating dioxygenase large terminal subunit